MPPTPQPWSLFGPPQLASYSGGPFGPVARPAATRAPEVLPPLAPEEEESMLRKMVNVPLSGVAWVGSELDKLLGGRAVRAAAHGLADPNAGFRDVLSIIPGSDVMGITDPEQNTTGRHLLEDAGMLTPKGPDDGFGLGDVAGIVAEAALSPDMWINPLAPLTKGAGAVAKAIGAVPKTKLAGITTTLESSIAAKAAEEAAAKMAEPVGRMAAHFGPDAARAAIESPIAYRGYGGAAELSPMGRQMANAGQLGEAVAAPANVLGRQPEEFLREAATNNLMQNARGVAASKPGIGPIEDILGQPVRTQFGIQPPLFKEPIVSFGTGPTSQKIAAGMDWLGDKARWSAPGRVGAALFDRNAGGVVEKEGQESAAVAAKTFKREMADGNEKTANILLGLERDGLMTPEGREALRDYIETQTMPSLDGQTVNKMGQLEAAYPDAADAIKNAASPMREEYERTRFTNLGLGADEHALAEAIDGAEPGLQATDTYSARYLSGQAGKGQARARTHASMISRKDVFGNLPTNLINDISTDESIAGRLYGLKPGEVANGMSDEEATRYIMGGYLNVAKEDLDALPQLRKAAEDAEVTGIPMAPADQSRLEALDAKQVQAEKLATYMGGRDPSHVKAGSPLFGNDPLQDFQRRLTIGKQVTANLTATHDLFSKVAVPLDEIDSMVGHVPVADAFRESQMPGGGALAEFARRKGLSAEEVANWAIPAKFVQSANNLNKAWSTPASLEPILNLFDQAQRWWKASVTLWPASRTRDLVTNAWQYFVDGSRDARYAGPQAFTQPWVDARALLKGRAVKDFNEIADFQGLTPKQAQEKLAVEMYAHGVAEPASKYFNEGLDDVSEQFSSDMMQKIPGRTPYESMTPLASIKRAIPKSLKEANPLNVAGVRGATDVFTPAKEGRYVAGYVDNLGRTASYIAKRRMGYSPEAAAAETLAAFGDFSGSAKTGFEKAAVSRAIPFYSFTRQMLPFQLQQMIGRPSGPVNLAMKAANSVRQQEGFLPEQIAQGMAFPLGKDEESGRSSFLTRLDLPHEAIFDQMFRPGATPLDTAKKTGMAMLGQLTPFVKTPLELATGTQFFTGRPLEELDSSYNRMVENVSGKPLTELMPFVTPSALTFAEEVSNATPLSRFVTTGRQLTDPQKLDAPWKLGVNLLTGARISDVDMDRAKEAAAQKMIQQKLIGEPGVHTFESMYVRPEDMATLTPEQVAMLQLNKSIVKRRQGRAADRKKAAASPVPSPIPALGW